MPIPMLWYSQMNETSGKRIYLLTFAYIANNIGFFLVHQHWCKTICTKRSFGFSLHLSKNYHIYICNWHTFVRFFSLALIFSEYKLSIRQFDKNWYQTQAIKTAAIQESRMTRVKHLFINYQRAQKEIHSTHISIKSSFIMNRDYYRLRNTNVWLLSRLNWNYTSPFCMNKDYLK